MEVEHAGVERRHLALELKALGNSRVKDDNFVFNRENRKYFFYFFFYNVILPISDYTFFLLIIKMFKKWDKSFISFLKSYN